MNDWMPAQFQVGIVHATLTVHGKDGNMTHRALSFHSLWACD